MPRQHDEGRRVVCRAHLLVDVDVVLEPELAHERVDELLVREPGRVLHEVAHGRAHARDALARDDPAQARAEDIPKRAEARVEEHRAVVVRAAGDDLVRRAGDLICSHDEVVALIHASPGHA
jgi:hypothetical protein